MKQEFPWNKLGLLAVSILVALVVSEVLVRLFLTFQYNAELKNWRGHALYALEDDPVLAYSLRPGAERLNRIPGNPEGAWFFRINSAGMRNREVTCEKSKLHRIVMLGDSYTFGWATDQDTTCPVHLESLMRSGDWPVEILNMGVPGYNTVQENQALQRRAIQYTPDLVILCFTCNDAEPQKNVPGHPSMRYAGFGSWGIGLARYFVSSTFSNRERKTEADETFPHDYDFHYPNSFEPGCRKAGACRSALESMARFCREQGIGFICFMMPDFTTKFDADYPYFTIHEKVRHWCQESDILCIDLLPRFIGLDNMALNVPSDGHPSSEGHLLLAEAMFEAVDFHFPGLKRKE